MSYLSAYSRFPLSNPDRHHILTPLLAQIAKETDKLPPGAVAFWRVASQSEVEIGASVYQVFALLLQFLNLVVLFSDGDLRIIISTDS